MNTLQQVRWAASATMFPASSPSWATPVSKSRTTFTQLTSCIDTTPSSSTTEGRSECIFVSEQMRTLCAPREEPARAGVWCIGWSNDDSHIAGKPNSSHCKCTNMQIYVHQKRGLALEHPERGSESTKNTHTHAHTRRHVIARIVREVGGEATVTLSPFASVSTVIAVTVG